LVKGVVLVKDVRSEYNNWEKIREKMNDEFFMRFYGVSEIC